MDAVLASPLWPLTSGCSSARDLGLLFLAGFASATLLGWLNRLFEQWLFGRGVLRGQQRRGSIGHFVMTSRGRVHYVFLQRYTEPPGPLPPLPELAAPGSSLGDTVTSAASTSWSAGFGSFDGSDESDALAGPPSPVLARLMGEAFSASAPCAHQQQQQQQQQQQGPRQQLLQQPPPQPQLVRCASSPPPPWSASPASVAFPPPPPMSRLKPSRAAAAVAWLAGGRGLLNRDTEAGAAPRTPLLGSSTASSAATARSRRVGQVLRPGSQSDLGHLVIIVHGFAGSNDAFISDERSCYASWLNRNGFSVLCPDLHGAGHSDGPDTAYSSELFVEQLAELCLTFGLQRPFDLVGFSMGGSVAVQFAYRYPHLVRRLVLQAPHVIETPLRLALRVALRLPFFREALSYIILPFVGECAGNPAAMRACFRLLRTRITSGGRWGSPGEGGSTKEMLSELGRSRVVYFLWGERDAVVRFAHWRKIKQLAPNAQLVTYEDADHMAWADGAPETRAFFRAALLDLLLRDEPAAPRETAGAAPDVAAPLPPTGLDVHSLEELPRVHQR